VIASAGYVMQVRREGGKRGRIENREWRATDRPQIGWMDAEGGEVAYGVKHADASVSVPADSEVHQDAPYDLLMLTRA